MEQENGRPGSETEAPVQATLGSWTAVSDDYPSRQLTMVEYGEVHDVFPGLLPFDSQSAAPVDVLCDVQGIVDEKCATAASVKSNEIVEATSIETDGIHWYLIPALEMGCLWHVPHRSGSNNRDYLNPEYVHAHTVFSTDAGFERDRLVRSLATQGVYSREQAAARVGLTPDSFREYLDERDYLGWGVWREQGLRRLSRTLQTCLAWGHTVEELATALRKSEAQITEWVARSRATGFEPPADPSRNGRWEWGGGDA